MLCMRHAAPADTSVSVQCGSARRFAALPSTDAFAAVFLRSRYLVVAKRCVAVTRSKPGLRSKVSIAHFTHWVSLSLPHSPLQKEARSPDDGMDQHRQDNRQHADTEQQ